MGTALAILSSVACPPLKYFPTLSQKRHVFRGGVIEQEMFEFLFSLQLLSETFLTLRRIHRDTIINVHILHVKYPLFLPDFNET